MAEGILRDKWRQNSGAGLVVSSMGVHGLDSQGPSELAQQVCAEHGIDISAHLSRQLSYDDLEKAHIILAMEPLHREFINLFFPRFSDKVFLLGAWPDKETRKSTIADPMGKPIKVYRRAYDIIAGHIDRIVPKIEETFG
jgi:protein-tyrosine phosphatase